MVIRLRRLIRYLSLTFVSVLQALGILITQDATLHLACGTTGKFATELDSSWCLVGCDTLTAPGYQILGQFIRGSDALTRLDKGDDALPPFFIGHTNNGSIGNSGVPHESRFNLSWIDIYAAGEDHIGATVAKIEPAIFVQVAEIANGYEIATLYRSCLNGVLIVGEIAQRRAEIDHSHLVWW